MTRIEDRLTEASRQLRRDIDNCLDMDGALQRTIAPTRGPARSRGLRGPLLIAAAILAVVAVAGVVASVVVDDERSVVADGSQRSDGSDTTSPDAPGSTGAAGTGVTFELLGEFPTSAAPGLITYAGVADALSDQWAAADVPGAPPMVNFEHQVVLAFVLAHLDNCPKQLVSIERSDSFVIPVFVPRQGNGTCGREVARIYIVAVGRADASTPFSVTIGVAPDGSPEHRLEVDAGANEASNLVPQPPSSDPTPAGPDLQSPEPGREVTFDGAGEVRLGQVLDPLAVSAYEGGGSCGYWGPSEPSHDGDEPLTGLVARADTWTPRVMSIMIRRNPRYRTASGVGVGTTLASLERIYGGDLVVDRADGWEKPTDGLLGQYQDVAAVRHGDGALTFYLSGDIVETVKVSNADFWGDDEGCA